LSEAGWPIHVGTAVTSHTGGALIQRYWMAIAIAMYDEYPTFFEYVGGAYFQVYLGPRNLWNVSGTHHQGTVYGVGNRFEEDINAQYLIYQMTGGINDRDGNGAMDGFVSLDASAQSVLYHALYSTRPDGQLFREGDCWEENQTDRGELWDNIARVAYKIGTFYQDPMAKRYAMEFSNLDFSHGNALYALLVSNTSVGTQSYATLPYTKYFPTPSGSMTARTGWDMGIESDDVLVRMQLTQAYLNNHQHRDAGNFQIYYKGILASESGYYVTYGTAHDTYYTKSSIAHNTLSITSIRNRYGTQVSSNRNDDWGTDGKTPLQTTVLGHEYGPNTYKPEYSYLAGDIAGAYVSDTDKNVQEAVRSMLFLNLELDGNTANPGAFIVFDQIKTLEVGSKKSFLLHMQSEPEIDENVVIIKNTKEDYNGMLTNQVVYVGTAQKADEDYTITKIGGPGKQFLVGSYNYAHSDIIGSTLSQEQGWGRVEISTTTTAKDQTDYLLNVMYVGDADGEAKTIPAKLIYDGKGIIMGAQLMNHVAMFNMDGNNRISKEVSFTIPANDGYNTFKVNVAGLKAGTWTVYVNGKSAGTQIASEDGGMIYFEAAAGTVKLVYTDANANKTFDETPIVIENEPIGLMVNNFFYYTQNNPVEIDGDYLVPLGLTFEALNAHVEWSKDNTSFVTTFKGQEYRVSADGIKVDGEAVAHKEIRPANGDLMVDASTLNILFAEYGKVYYDRFINRIRVNVEAMGVIPGLTDNVLNEYPTATQVAGLIDLGYSTTDMASALDGDPETRWVSQTEASRRSEGVFDMGKVVPLTEMMIMFYTEPDLYSNYVFDVYTSVDGKEYELLFENIKSGEIDPDTYFEHYTTVLLDAEARYVKIMGKGRYRYTSAGRQPDAVNNTWTSIAEIIFLQQAIIDPNGEPVKGNKLLAEAECFNMADGATVEKNKNASGKETVLLSKGYSGNPGAVAGSTPQLSATFIPQRTGTYYIWAKVNTHKVTSGDSMWVSIGGVTGTQYYSEKVIFNGKKCANEKEFVWVKLGQYEIQSAFAQWQKEQEYTLSVISGCEGLIVDCFVLSMDPAYCPIGAPYQATTSVTGELSVNASDAIYVPSMAQKSGTGATLQKVSADGVVTAEYLDYVLKNKNLPGDITLQINTDDSGKYTIWATVKASSLSRDQFFCAISVNDAEYKYTLHKLSELAPGYTAGTYVTVKLGEVEAQAREEVFVRIKAHSEGVTFGTISTTCEPATGVYNTTNGKVTIQAEDGLLGQAGEETVIISGDVYYDGELATIIDSQGATGGKAVKLVKGYSAWNQMIVVTSEANSHLSVKVKPDVSGEYFIWVKVYAPKDSAIYAWIDGGEDTYYWRQPLTADTYSVDEDNYIWVRLWRECRAEYTLRQERFYDWTARRVYTISLRSYTAGVVIDEIYVTNDPNDQPHNHSYTENWVTNDTHHWYAPTCGCADAALRLYGEHYFEDHTDNACNTCGHQNPNYAPHNYVNDICTICGGLAPFKTSGGKLTLEAEDLMLAPDGTENFIADYTGSVVKVVQNAGASAGEAVRFTKTHPAWNSLLTAGSTPIPHLSALIAPDKTGEYYIWVRAYAPRNSIRTPAVYAYIQDDTGADTYYYRQPLFMGGYSGNEQDYVWVRVHQEYRVDTALKGERTYKWTAGHTYAIRFRGCAENVQIDQIYITTDPNFNPHNHTYSETWSSNDTEHWRNPTCGDTTVVADKAAHVYDDLLDTTCNTCGYVRAPHEHTHSTKWSADGTGHWHECACGDKVAYAEHTFVERICSSCGMMQPIKTEGGKLTVQAEEAFRAEAGTENFITDSSAASGFYEGNLVVLDQSNKVVRFEKGHSAWNQYINAGSDPIAHLSFYVTPDVTGEYYIWAKVYAPADSSVYCYIDGGQDTYYWRQPLTLNGTHSANTSDYIWVRLHQEYRNGTTLTNDKSYNWTAGQTYAVKLRSFTQWVRINEFYITNDALDVPHNHTWSETWSSNETEHWREPACDDTDVIKDKGAHIYDDATDTTCNICGYERPAHEHVYGTTWTADAFGHWYACACGDKKQYATHNFENDICTECGVLKPFAITDGKLTVQAEDTNLMLENDSLINKIPVTIYENPAASNGKVVHTTSDKKPTLDVNSPAHISFSVTPTQSGYYYIWAKVLTGNATSIFRYVDGDTVGAKVTADAGYVYQSMGTASNYSDGFVWQQSTTNSNFVWVRLGSSSNPYHWTAGEVYNIRFRSRNYQLAIDEFLIVSDASFVPQSHVHTFDTEWSSDASYHWHAATCEHTTQIADKAEHVYTDDTDASCNTCGYERTIHTHTYNQNWSSDSTHHWKEATCCQGLVGEKGEHTFVNMVCSVCNANYLDQVTVEAENANLFSGRDDTNQSYQSDKVTSSAVNPIQYFTNEYASGSNQIVRLNGYYTHGNTPAAVKPSLLLATNPAHLSFTHTAKSSGTYTIWAKVVVSGTTGNYLKYIDGDAGTGDSAYVYTAHSNLKAYNSTDKWGSNVFNWIKVGTYEWTEGNTYTIRFRGANIYTAFDQFVVTNDANFDPAN